MEHDNQQNIPLTTWWLDAKNHQKGRCRDEQKKIVKRPGIDLRNMSKRINININGTWQSTEDPSHYMMAWCKKSPKGAL